MSVRAHLSMCLRGGGGAMIELRPMRVYVSLPSLRSNTDWNDQATQAAKATINLSLAWPGPIALAAH